MKKSFNKLVNHYKENKKINKDLLEAAKEGSLHTIKELVNRGADINICDNELIKILVRKGYIEPIKYLIEEKKTIAHLDDKNELLVISARNGYLNILDYLIKQGGNINQHIKYNKGGDIVVETPLIEAMKANKIDVIKYLIEQGADINKGEGFAFLNSISKKDRVLIDLMIEKGVNIKDYEKNIIGLCITIGNLDMLKLFIDKGLNIDVENGFSLMVAVRENHIDIVDYILNKGIDINSNDGEALRTAVWLRNISMIENLLNKGADINLNNEMMLEKISSFHYENQKRQMKDLLISKGMKINIG